MMMLFCVSIFVGIQLLNQLYNVFLYVVFKVVFGIWSFKFTVINLLFKQGKLLERIILHNITKLYVPYKFGIQI